MTPRSVERLAGGLILALGALHAFAARHYASPDGVSYLDIATNYLDRGWSAAINGYFSPLYSWLLLAPLGLRPAPEQEGPWVHLLNWVLLAVCLAAFAWFWRQLRALLPEAPAAASTALAYALFGWGALRMVSVRIVAPDQLYAAIVFALAAVLTRIARRAASAQAASTSDVLWLGALWSAAYLARSAALPVIALTALAAVWLLGRSARAATQVAAAAGLAALLSAPWVYALSQQKGRLTLGSTGTLIYAWHINGRPWEHNLLEGMPHPSRLLATAPALYEFATPVAGTYPPWTDPSYWNEGLPMQLDLRSNLSHLIRNLRALLQLLLELGAYLAALAAWWLVHGTLRASLKALAALWWLWLPCLAGLGIYAALNVESRYFAAFWTILLLLPWMAARNTAGSARLANALAAGVVLVLAAALADFSVTQFYLGAEGRRNLTTAQALAAAAPEPRTLATIGIDNDVHWARLARARILAEIPVREAATFWNSPPARQAEILDLLRQAGARYVVAAPPPYPAAGWKPLPGRDFYFFPL